MNGRIWNIRKRSQNWKLPSGLHYPVPKAKWVASQSDINADWDGYLEQLDKLGLDQYLEYKGAVKS